MMMGLSLTVVNADPTPTITIQIDGTYNEDTKTLADDGTVGSGILLGEANTNSAISSSAIKHPKITEGALTSTDWNYMMTLTGMTHFEVDNGVTVSSMSDLELIPYGSLFSKTIISVNIP